VWLFFKISLVVCIAISGLLSWISYSFLVKDVEGGWWAFGTVLVAVVFGVVSEREYKLSKARRKKKYGLLFFDNLMYFKCNAADVGRVRERRNGKIIGVWL
jgi:hypothetical protein